MRKIEFFANTTARDPEFWIRCPFRMARIEKTHNPSVPHVQQSTGSFLKAPRRKPLGRVCDWNIDSIEVENDSIEECESKGCISAAIRSSDEEKKRLQFGKWIVDGSNHVFWIRNSLQ